MHPQYEEDIHAWAITSASLLRKGKINEVDMNRIAEEIEALGRSTKRELRSRLGILIAHLMKWEYQPEIRSKSWKGTIVRQRIDIQDILEENPSLQSQIDESISRSYKHALAILEEETPLNLKSLPKDCPYTFIQLMDKEFFPS